MGKEILMTEQLKSWVEKKGGKKKRGGQGSHGSLTKAGWARHNAPIRWDLRDRKTIYSKLPKKNIKKSKCPRTANRRRYEKRFVLNRKSGQNYVE